MWSHLFPLFCWRERERELSVSHYSHWLLPSTTTASPQPPSFLRECHTDPEEGVAQTTVVFSFQFSRPVSVVKVQSSPDDNSFSFTKAVLYIFTCLR